MSDPVDALKAEAEALDWIVDALRPLTRESRLRVMEQVGAALRQADVGPAHQRRVVGKSRGPSAVDRTVAMARERGHITTRELAEAEGISRSSAFARIKTAMDRGDMAPNGDGYVAVAEAKPADESEVPV